MRSVVSSLALRVVYLLAGGIPALCLAALCLVFLPSTFWAAHTPYITNHLEATLTTVLFVVAILGTVSGWLTFFAIGIHSKTGRIVHYLALSGGIFAAVFFLFTLPVITLDNFIFGAAPAIVGCCLLFHLSRTAKLGAQEVPTSTAELGL
jgi:hypothetical protein